MIWFFIFFVLFCVCEPEVSQQTEIKIEKVLPSGAEYYCLECDSLLAKAKHDIYRGMRMGKNNFFSCWDVGDAIKCPYCSNIVKQFANSDNWAFERRY